VSLPRNGPPAATSGELPAQVLDALRRYDTPTLANAIEVFDVRPRDEGFASPQIRCLFPELPVTLGYAATATIRARGAVTEGNQQSLYDHVQTLPAPRLVVVQDLDQPPGHGALWGEVQSSIFSALGCAGCVTDGCVRDLTEVRATGFQFFAAAVGVSHAYVRVEEVGLEVTVGGLRVRPGDLIHGDQHGVLLIPPQIAAELPAAADAIIEREQRLIGWVRSAEFSPSRLAEMRRIRH
jgi:regulator of RNase E activity RraA